MGKIDKKPLTPIKGVVRFDGDITTKKVAKLLNEISFKLKEYENIIIYMTTPGGDVPDGMILVDYLNMHKDRIELVFTWAVSSTGFEVMIFYKGKKRLVKPIYGMIHLGSNLVDVIELKDKNSYDTLCVKNVNTENKRRLIRYKKWLTKDEYERVKLGEEVYLPYKRVNEILKLTDIF